MHGWMKKEVLLIYNQHNLTQNWQVEDIKMLLPKTILTLNAQFKAHMAEGKRSCVRFQFTDAADVVIVQVYVHKVLLFLHDASAKQTEQKQLFNTFNLTLVPFEIDA